MEEGAHLAQIPKQAFEHGTLDKSLDIANEGNISFVTDHVEYSDGIYTYIIGAKYPMKGMITPDIMWQCNIIKRVFMELLKTFSFRLIFKKERQSLVNSFNMIADKTLKTALLKFHLLTGIAQQLYFIVKRVLMSLGIEEESAKKFSLYFVHLIQYDDAYRYRLQDIFSETNAESLALSPIIELDRLLLILESRDIKGVSDKFRKLFNVIALFLCIPKYRMAFKNAILNCKFEHLQYDEGDRYWVCMRNDYKFLGMTQDERLKLIGDTPPKFIAKVKDI